MKKDWFGHPRGLFVLFLTEMWERFSYYGMRALLVLYMTDSLIVNAEKGQRILGYESIKSAIAGWLQMTGFTGEMTAQVLSSQLYGLYTAFVYLTPFFGGILADRVFGQNKSVYIGATLMAIGHFLMASEQFFFVALLFLVLGNGCFKPNITSQVGSLYAPGDSRRDSAYTLFYMGINLGAFFAPFVCGTLGQKVGWHYGFGAAGVGMLIGLIVYHFGRHHLPKHVPTYNLAATGVDGSGSLTATEWKKIAALIVLCIVNVVFWATYEQQGNTLQLWADEKTDFNFFGWEMPTTWYQSFNPFFIFVFAPILGKFWSWQARRRGGEPSSTMKMGIGCLLVAAAFVIMIFAARAIPDVAGDAGEAKLSLFWLASSCWLLTMGELYLSPIGLSLVSKVAPKRIVSMMMGVWFLSSFFGNYLSGYIGGYYNVMSKETFFALLMALAIGAALIFFAAQKPLEKMMKAEN